MKTTKIADRFYAGAVSESWDGFDVGLFSMKVVSKPEIGKKKALRIVVWRFAAWIELKDNRIDTFIKGCKWLN